MFDRMRLHALTVARAVVFPVVLASLIVAGIAGCAVGTPPSVVVLPNGYEIVRNKASQPIIVKGGGRMTAGPVAAYAVVRDVVLGMQAAPTVAKDSNRATKTQPAPAASYFVLKTSSGEVSTGLSEDDWKARLKAVGVEQVPTLNPPLL